MEAGWKASELARELGVIETTQYVWKSHFCRLESNEARRLHDLEQERARSKTLADDFVRDKDARQTVIRNNGWSLSSNGPVGCSYQPGMAGASPTPASSRNWIAAHTATSLRQTATTA